MTAVVVSVVSMVAVGWRQYLPAWHNWAGGRPRAPRHHHTPPPSPLSARSVSDLSVEQCIYRGYVSAHSLSMRS